MGFFHAGSIFKALERISSCKVGCYWRKMYGCLSERILQDNAFPSSNCTFSVHHRLVILSYSRLYEKSKYERLLLSFFILLLSICTFKNWASSLMVKLSMYKQTATRDEYIHIFSFWGHFLRIQKSFLYPFGHIFLKNQEGIMIHSNWKNQDINGKEKEVCWSGSYYLSYFYTHKKKRTGM